MWIDAPCKPKNGVGCSKRDPFCHSNCPDYLAYRARLDSINSAKHAERESANFAAEQIFQNRRNLKYSEAGRRALAQR